MSETLQSAARVFWSMSILPDIQAQKNLPILVAQATPPPDFLSQFGLSPNNPVLTIILAVITLVVGWIFALIASSITSNLLKRTSADNQIAGWVSGGDPNARPLPVEKWAASFVFWVVMVFVLVAFLQILGLSAVATPINRFLEQILTFLPKLGGAILLLGIAWILATVSKSLLIRSLRSLQLEERLNEQFGTTNNARTNLSETLASVLYWLIFLLFLPLILEALELRQTLAPLNNLTDQFLKAIPKIIQAIAVGGIGWLIAVVVRRLVTNLLSASGIDSLGSRFGLSQTAGSSAPSSVIGTIAYVLILIPVAISALEALELRAVSAPASDMLGQALRTLPQIFMAGVVLVIAYFAGRFIDRTIANILTGLGFNNVLPALGFPQLTGTAQTTDSTPESEGSTIQQTPSEIVGIVAFIGIMLFAAITATNILGIPALTSLLRGIIDTSGQILGGLIVFAIGLYLANLAFNLVNAAGTRQSRILGHTARISIIAFSGALGLQQMGIATNIVQLAFGLLLGAIAVAIAIAFGLGGRDIAAEQIREWLASLKRND
ncbi:mechanosensitive ion channel [Pseudanabaena sp. PCC 6802]|uniref:mechanosensitive ion channel n=1 Tax=Pseudanabaena sp. PCC 6802 TaxID=118173 RepID=UPI00034AB81B|nr:mechanosensitive ion channel [Pseudanabaena sp. PCC 6802]